MKKLRKILALLTAAALVFGVQCVLAEKEITVEFDGQPLSFDVRPQIIDNTTMVPLRKIFEEIGALVKWDGETKTVTARKGSKTVSMTIDSADMLIYNGKTDSEGNEICESVTLDVPSKAVSGRTLVPLRAVSEAFNLDVKWDGELYKVSINSKEDDDSWKSNTGTIDLSNMTCEGNGVAVDGKEIKITEGGDFTVNGKTADGSIVVNTKERVKLRLNNAEIHSKEKPCIYFEDVDKGYITIEDSTENILVSSCADGAVYSKDNLEIKGGGSLDITAETGCGIKASDNLTIENGKINITAANDGINVNDTFKMSGGSVNVESVCDGVSSDSIVMIEGGSLNIKTTLEPLNAEEIEGNAASQNGPAHMESVDADFEESTKGIKADWMLVINGGEIKVDSSDHCVHCADEIEINGGNLELTSAYGKGISGHGDVTVDGEDTVIYVLNSTEGIESKNVLTVNNGYINIVASDDAINATGGASGERQMPFGGNGRQNEVTGRPEMNPDMMPNEKGQTQMPDGDRRRPGRFDAEQGMPPEGADWQNIPDNPRMDGHDFVRQNLKDAIVINGGTLELTAGFDCLDSNGNLLINEGTVMATSLSGGIFDMDGILDADGQITVGENVVIIGVAGRGSRLNPDFPSNSVMLYTGNAHSGGEKIVLKDEDGTILADYAPQGGFNTVFITSPSLKTGESYTIAAGDEENTFTVEQKTTEIGTAPQTRWPKRDFGLTEQ